MTNLKPIHHATIKKASKLGLVFEEDGGTWAVRKPDSKIIGRGKDAKLLLEDAINTLKRESDGKDAPVAKKKTKTSAKKADDKDEKKVSKGKSIVKSQYRASYNYDQNCGDDFAVIFRADTMVSSEDGKKEVMSRDNLSSIATENNDDISHLLSGGLNNGQISMSYRNTLRAKALSGLKVKIGKKVFNIGPALKEAAKSMNYNFTAAQSRITDIVAESGLMPENEVGKERAVKAATKALGLIIKNHNKSK